MGGLLCCDCGRVLVAGIMKDLDHFLEMAKLERSGKCTCCQNAELAAVIVEFLDKLASGETRVTLHHLHRHYLVPRFGKPKHAASVRNHVRECLKRDHCTGRPLDE